MINLLIRFFTFQESTLAQSYAHKKFMEYVCYFSSSLGFALALLLASNGFTILGIDNSFPVLVWVMTISMVIGVVLGYLMLGYKQILDYSLNLLELRQRHLNEHDNHIMDQIAQKLANYYAHALIDNKFHQAFHEEHLMMDLYYYQSMLSSSRANRHLKKFLAKQIKQLSLKN